MGPPKEKPDGCERPIGVKIISTAPRRMSRCSGSPTAASAQWRIGAGWKKPVPVLLLDHVGRKSGTRFTTPPLYMCDGANVVIVASQGGLPKHPQWFHNLLAHPDTTIHLPRERGR